VGAKEYLERALDAHPWAAHVPAILNVLVSKPGKPATKPRERKSRQTNKRAV
jgi:hypothetical protein